MSSITIWAQYRLDTGEVINDEADKHQLIEYMETLDDLCAELEIPPLSSLVDYSGGTDSFDEDLDEEDEYLLGEFNLSKDDDEGEWFVPRETIHIIDSLLMSLSDQPDLLEAPAHHLQELQEELEQCLRFLQEAIEQQSEAFRFILISD